MSLTARCSGRLDYGKVSIGLMKRRKSRVRRTYAEMFLDALKELSGDEQKLVSNSAVRDTLQWEEGRYPRIKRQLVDENKVIIGRGYGGSVGLATAQGARALNIFISYSHADEALKESLVKHLTPLKQMGLIDAWHDRKIPPGAEWKPEISKNLETARIVLLLVSIDFIASKYCYDIELERALEMHDEKRARVIPIILRSCMWQHTSLAKLQAAPKDGKPVCTWSDRDEAFSSVAESIKQVAEELMST